MFAVIKTGGKQYRVAEGQTLSVERLPGEAGDSVALDQVLMVGNGESTTVGTPLVAGATVAAEILEQGRGPKVIVFKKKRRKGYRRRNGHRQDLTLLQVTEILTDGKAPSGKKATKPKAAEPKKAETETPEEEVEATVPEATESEAPQAEAPEAAEVEAGAAEVEAQAPETLSAPEGEADDLKKIGGVGPKIEEKLNALGIYHYRQIAAFTPENAAWLDQELHSKGRVEREDWVGQAKALADGKED